MNATLKKIYHALVICLATVSFGAEQLTFTPAHNQTTIVASEKTGNNIKLSVSPDIIAKTAQDTPRQVFNTLQAELGKAIEANGGMIPGKVYIKKNKDGTVNASVSIRGKRYNNEKDDEDDEYETLGYCTGIVILELKNINSDKPEMTIKPDYNENLEFMECVVYNKDNKAPNGQDHLSYVLTWAHEMMHYNDMSYSIEDVTYYCIASSYDFDLGIFSNINDKNTEHGKNMAKLRDNLREAQDYITLYSEARAVRSEIIFCTIYLANLKDDIKSHFEKLSNKQFKSTKTKSKFAKTFLKFIVTIKADFIIDKLYNLYLIYLKNKNALGCQTITNRQLLDCKTLADIIKLAEKEVLNLANAEIEGIYSKTLNKTTYANAFSKYGDKIKKDDIFDEYGYICQKPNLYLYSEHDGKFILINDPISLNSEHCGNLIAQNTIDKKKANHNNFVKYLRAFRDRLKDYYLCEARYLNLSNTSYSELSEDIVRDSYIADDFQGKPLDVLFKETFYNDLVLLNKILNKIADEETAIEYIDQGGPLYAWQDYIKRKALYIRNKINNLKIQEPYIFYFLLNDNNYIKKSLDNWTNLLAENERLKELNYFQSSSASDTTDYSKYELENIEKNRKLSIKFAESIKDIVDGKYKGIFDLMGDPTKRENFLQQIRITKPTEELMDRIRGK